MRSIKEIFDRVNLSPHSWILFEGKLTNCATNDRTIAFTIICQDQVFGQDKDEEYRRVNENM